MSQKERISYLQSPHQENYIMSKRRKLEVELLNDLQDDTPVEGSSIAGRVLNDEARSSNSPKCTSDTHLDNERTDFLNSSAPNKSDDQITVKMSEENSLCKLKDWASHSQRSPSPASSNSGCSNTSCQQNQVMVCEVLGELSTKLDYIMATLKRIESSTTMISGGMGTENMDEEECNILNDWIAANLPLKSNNKFSEFEEKLRDISFRKILAGTMFDVIGDSINRFTNGVMRRLITDELAEEYSLMGMKTIGSKKKSFITTRTFFFVKEVCVEKFKNWNEKIFREGVRCYLSQAKPRQVRRNERMKNVAQETADMNNSYY